MESGERLSLEQMRAFLEASEEVEFAGRNREEVYGWVEEMLRQQNYGELGRAGRGLVRRYLQKMTGRSRAQITRLIKLYQQGEPVRPKPYRRRRFPARYTRADIELLAKVDEAHETLNGPATQKILQREFHDFGDQHYERLARLSVA
ncbi:MAG: integrase, partial [bacterium]|nr:integrase [bacterium]